MYILFLMFTCFAANILVSSEDTAAMSVMTCSPILRNGNGTLYKVIVFGFWRTFDKITDYTMSIIISMTFQSSVNCALILFKWSHRTSEYYRYAFTIVRRNQLLTVKLLFYIAYLNTFLLYIMNNLI